MGAGAASRGGHRGSLTIILVVILLVQFAQHATRPMASYRALGLDATLDQLGLLALSFSALSIAIAIPVGRLVDARGARPATVLGIVLMGLSTFAHAAVDSVGGLIGAHAVFGLGLLFAVVGLQSSVASAGSTEGADARFGWFASVVAIGQVLGPLVAGVLAETWSSLTTPSSGDPFGTALVFMVAGSVCIIAALLALRLPHQKHDPDAPDAISPAPRATLVSVVRAPHMPSALWASMVVVVTTDLLAFYLPVVGTEGGWSVAFVSVLLGVRAAASFAVRLITGPLVRALGRRPLLVGACSIAGAAQVGLIPHAPDWVAVVMVAVIGVVLGVGQPLTMAWVARLVPDNARGTALGVRLTVNRTGESAIPLVVGAVAAVVGSGVVLFPLLAVLLMSTSIVVARSGLR